MTATLVIVMESHVGTHALVLELRQFATDM